MMRIYIYMLRDPICYGVVDIILYSAIVNIYIYNIYNLYIACFLYPRWILCAVHSLVNHIICSDKEHLQLRQWWERSLCSRHGKTVVKMQSTRLTWEDAKLWLKSESWRGLGKAPLSTNVNTNSLGSCLASSCKQLIFLPIFNVLHQLVRLWIS